MSLHGDQIRPPGYLTRTYARPCRRARRARTGYRRGVGGSHTMLPTNNTHRDRHPDVIHQHHVSHVASSTTGAQINPKHCCFSDARDKAPVNRSEVVQRTDPRTSPRAASGCIRRGAPRFLTCGERLQQLTGHLRLANPSIVLRYGAALRRSRDLRGEAGRSREMSRRVDLIVYSRPPVHG